MIQWSKFLMNVWYLEFILILLHCMHQKKWIGISDYQFFFFSFLQFHQCNVYSIILQQMNLLVCNCVFPISADSAIAFLNQGGKRMIGCCINQCPFIYLFQTKPLWQNTMHTVMGACVGSPFWSSLVQLSSIIIQLKCTMLSGQPPSS